MNIDKNVTTYDHNFTHIALNLVQNNKCQTSKIHIKVTNKHHTQYKITNMCIQYNIYHNRSVVNHSHKQTHSLS